MSKSGFVAVVGLPNAGKSSLVNALVGEKFSIVSAKPQTTRKRVLGIAQSSHTQAVFVDAPGMVRAEKGLNKFLFEEYQDVIKNSDVVLALLNVDAPSFEALQPVVELAQNAKKPALLVIHKTDLPEIHRPQILRDKLQDSQLPVISGSSLKNFEVLKDQIWPFLTKHLPEGPFLYEEDLFTLATQRELAAELVREKAFELLRQEVPFGLATRVAKFEEGPVLKIFIELLVAKENHRAIVIGAGGKLIKEIGSLARKDMEEMFAQKVYLDLHVTVKKNWPQKEQWLKELGYVIANPRS